MNKSVFVNGFDSKDNFGNIESRNWNGEDLILDEHSHKISSWQEFH